MKQPSLFPEDAAPGATLLVPGIPVGGGTLNKAQKQFNKLIAKIEGQRRLLAQWNDFVPRYQKRYATEVEPLNRRMREGRIAMVRLLDRAMDDRTLGKSHRAKVRDILLDQLTGLLSEGEDAELVSLYDKYSDISFEEAREEDLAMTQAMASSLFGVELDGDGPPPATAEELAQQIADKMKAAQEAEQARQAQAPRRGRKPGAKAAAREALREQAAHGATRSLREVYRKLASELHPDRETDDAERKRKTALMQQVNQAYEKGDLLALLELQLAIEQLDPKALASMAQERLVHYNHVLAEQSKRLDEELAELTMPFQTMLGGRLHGQLTPEGVDQALNSDVREMKAALRGLQDDLKNFEDIKLLKSSLRHYRIGQNDEDDFGLIEALMAAEMRGRRR